VASSESEPGEFPIAVGAVLAEKYRVESVVGAGGMGVVYRAHHLALDQPVAVKVLRSSRHDERSAERLTREARALAKLRSVHVARVLDAGHLDDGSPYVVMEYLDGCDLNQIVKVGGPLNVATACGHIVAACEALAQAHAIGIVHRDLKPSNLFVSHEPDGSNCLKVLDFGICKTLREGIANRPEDHSITGTSDTVGTPRYMAPEQLRSAMAVDARADIWSLGVILYELLAGVSPFGEGSLAELHVAVLDGKVEPIGRLRDDVPPEVADIIERCMQKDVTQRYPTIGALARDLEPFAKGDVRGLIAGIERWEDRSAKVEQTTQAGQVATTRAAATLDAPSNTKTTWGGEVGRRGSRARSLGLFGAGLVIVVVAGLLLLREEPKLEPTAPGSAVPTAPTAQPAPETTAKSAPSATPDADPSAAVPETTSGAVPSGVSAVPSVPPSPASKTRSAANSASAATNTATPVAPPSRPSTKSARDPMEIRQWK